jgi:Fe-S-cluster containining protein
VSDGEIEALARRLELTPAAFRETYTRRLRGGERSLREQRNRDCVFYRRSGGCSVYEDRPRQCRTWPFWRSVVHSRERWEEEAEGCPGMNRGPLHGAGEILGIARDDGTSGRLPD